MNEKALLIEEIIRLLPLASFAGLEFVFYFLVREKNK